MDPEFDAETMLALWAARQTGLLEAYLREAGTPETAAELTDVTPDAARVIGRVLVETGVLVETDDGFQPANRALGLLTSRDARSIGRLPARLDTIDALVSLPETMTAGVPPTVRNDARMHAVGAREATDTAVVRASVTVATRAAPEADEVLELAGGAGTYAAEFAKRGWDATVHDAPALCERLDDLHASRDVRSASGALDELGRDFELIFWADGPTRMNGPEVATTLAAASDRLTDDGTLVVIDRFGDVAADVRGLATGGGGGHDTDTVCDWLSAAGCSPREESVPGTPLTAVIADSV